MLFGSNLALGAGATLGGAAAGSIFGSSDGAQKRAARKAWHRTKQGMKLGNKLDIANQQTMFDFRLQRGREAGLTNVEIFGSPASGAGGGTTGSGATLGNAANTQGMQQAQLEQDRKLAWQSKIADTTTALMQTKMQTDAQKDVAEMQTGATTRGQDINQQIAANTLNLERDKLKLERDKAASTIGMQRKQTEKLVTEIALNDKKWLLAMKQLSMGPQNLLTELTMRHHDISLSDDSFASLPKAKRVEILNEIIALSSKFRIEQSGLAALGEKTVEGAKDTVYSVFEILQNAQRGIRNNIGDFIGLGNGPGSDSQAVPSLGQGDTGPYKSRSPSHHYR